MSYIITECMKEQFNDLPMPFMRWCNKWQHLHKEDPDYSILNAKEQKEYSERVASVGFDMTLIMLYLSACCYPNVPCRKMIMRQLYMRFGGNPLAYELIPFVDNLGNDLYNNINGIKKKMCLTE